MMKLQLKHSLNCILYPWVVAQWSHHGMYHLQVLRTVIMCINFSALDMNGVWDTLYAVANCNLHSVKIMMKKL